MLECLVGLIIFTIVIVAFLWVVDKCLTAVGWTAPPVIRMLVGLLAGLLILMRALACVPGGHLRLWQ